MNPNTPRSWGGGQSQDGPQSVSDLRTQRRPQEERQEDDGLPYQPPVSMAEVEERIMRADDELARLTETHVNLADQSARSEARWKNHRDRCIVKIVRGGDKGAKDTREAYAKEMECGSPRCPCSEDPYAGERLYEEYEIRVSAKDSSARAMRSIESRLNAFQTISANIRAATRY